MIGKTPPKSKNQDNLEEILKEEFKDCIGAITSKIIITLNECLVDKLTASPQKSKTEG